jgi:NAD(P)-dependent dehydrogenase (short-subunit alcohol dehydrogenase family)
MPSDILSTPTTPVVLIAGAAGALGEAVARHFAATGARLALLDQKATTQPWTAAENSMTFAVDLLDRQAVVGAIELVRERWGRVDVAVHVAGGFAMGEAVHETSDAVWTKLFDLNVRTMVNCASAVVPLMLQQGHGAIVNVGAASAQRGQAYMGAYAASKSSLARLTESMSGELGSQGIRVNAVLPSILDTTANRLAMPGANTADWVDPRDLAEVIAFLASDAARAIHGACLPVTGVCSGSHQ